DLLEDPAKERRSRLLGCKECLQPRGGGCRQTCLGTWMARFRVFQIGEHRVVEDRRRCRRQFGYEVGVRRQPPHPGRQTGHGRLYDEGTGPRVEHDPECRQIDHGDRESYRPCLVRRGSKAPEGSTTRAPVPGSSTPRNAGRSTTMTGSPIDLASCAARQKLSKRLGTTTAVTSSSTSGNRDRSTGSRNSKALACWSGIIDRR